MPMVVGARIRVRESYLAGARGNGSASGEDIVGKSEYLNFVNGEWVPSHTEATYTVINPATGGKIAAVPQSDVEDTRAAIDAAREAFDKGKWPRMTPGDRAGALVRAAGRGDRDGAGAGGAGVPPAQSPGMGFVPPV